MQIKRTGLILLILLISSLVYTVSAEPVISFNPDTVTMYPDSTAQVVIMLSEAPQGLAGYELTLNSPSSVATITDTIFPSWATLNKKTSMQSGITLSGVDLNKKVQSGQTNIELAIITVKGSSGGTSKISISGLQMDADGGAGLSPSLGTLDVTVLSLGSTIASATTATTVTTVATTTPVTTETTVTPPTTTVTPTPTLAAQVQSVAVLQYNENGKVLSTTMTVPTGSNSQAAPSVTIDKGTTALNSAGQPLTSVYVSTVAADTYSPPPIAQYSATDQVVQCGPAGATFNPPASLSFTLTETQWTEALAQANGNTAAMTVMSYDSTTNVWSAIQTMVDPQSRTLTATTPHFSTFGVFVNKTDNITSGTLTVPSVETTINQSPAPVSQKTKTTASVSQKMTTVPTKHASGEISTPILMLGFITMGGVILHNRKK